MSFAITAIDSTERASPASNRGFLLFMVVAVLTIRFLIAPAQFADYPSYVELLEELKFDGSINSFLMEPFSKFPLFLLGKFMSVEDAVTLFSYINTFVFLIFFGAIVLRKKRNASGLFLLLGMYAPLIAFISLRATPAYLCVALATEFLWEGRSRAALLMCLLASMFHFSAVMMFVPFAICIVRGRNRVDDVIVSTPLNAHAFMLCTVGIVLYLSGPVLFGALLQGLIPAESLLSRYSSYLLTVEREKISHIVYYFSVLALVCIFVRSATSRQKCLFFEVSLILFAVLAVSPVVAYRYSLYFVIPIFLNFPEHYSIAREFWKFIVIVPASVLFFFGVWQSLP